jgi:hypothetical protein
MESLFDRWPSDQHAMAEQVWRKAAEECSPDWCALAPALEACARDAVAALLYSRVKSFVPLLALRRVRACIRAGTCETEEF